MQIGRLQCVSSGVHAAVSAQVVVVLVLTNASRSCVVVVGPVDLETNVEGVDWKD